MCKYILAVSLMAFRGFAQTPILDRSLTFEVASIKPAQPLIPNARGFIPIPGPSGGPGTKDPGRINYPYMTLKSLLMTAYSVKNFQVSGPSWLDSERFDIVATIPPETTKEQLRIMLQNLLIDRFQMSVHREKKELPMYSLVVIDPRKLRESTANATPIHPDIPPPPGPPKMGPDGFPIEPAATSPGMIMFMVSGRARLTATAQSMQALADRFSNQLNRPVIDNTGLTAKYDFTLTYAPAPNEGLLGGGPGQAIAANGGGPGPDGSDNVFAPDGEPFATMFGAIQSQLGLKLAPKKGDVEIIVIDKIEKTPTGN
jgi:uncharacterized protein (TIGR03435 family)